MRVFSLFVAFIFSAVGIFALAADDVDAAVTTNNSSDISVISDEVSESDLYSDISTSDQLNTENEGEDEEDTDNKSEFSRMVAQLDTQNNEEEGEGENGEDSKGEGKFGNMFAELTTEEVKGEQAEGGQATGEAATEETKSEAATQVQTEEEAIADDKPSRWSLYVEFWEEDKFDKGSLESYITIRPQYQLTDKLRLGFSFESTVLWAAFGDRETTQYSMGDHYLMLSSSTALGPFDLFGYMRIYLPTSKATMAKGQIARVRVKPYLTLPVSKSVKFTVRLETNYFQHSVDSFRNTSTLEDTCNSAQYCSAINEQWRIEPMLGFLGKIHGPFSFESIHGFRFHSYFENNTIDDAANQKGHEIKWYNESGIMWDVNIGGVPVTLLAGFYDHRATGGSFLKRLPIVSYFTGPHEESWWVFSIWASI